MTLNHLTTFAYSRIIRYDRIVIHGWGRVNEIYCDISRYMFYAPVADKMNLYITIYWTYNGPTHFNIYSYPQTVFLQSKNRVRCVWEWIKQFYRGEIKSQKIFFYFTYPHNFIFKLHNLFKLRYSIDGLFINTNKVICGPMELVEFYDKKTLFDKPKLTYYLKKNSNYIDKVLNRDGKKIYISFGTNNIRYMECEKIIKRAIECLKDRNILVIINVGNINKIEMQSDANNIIFVQGINQADVIKKVDYVIFHGGFGTLKECYYFNKKVIVIPFMYDQFSNARLVEQIHLGEYIPKEEAEKVDFYKKIEYLDETLGKSNPHRI